MKAKWIEVVLLCMALCHTSTWSQERSTISNIDAAIASGHLDGNAGIQLKNFLVQGAPNSVPIPLRSSVADKCGFGIACEVHFANLTVRPGSTQDYVVDSVLYVHSFVAPAGPRAFHIYYYPSGPSQVPPADDNSNGVPDWVEKTGEYLEQSYRLQIDTLGYREPTTFASTGSYMEVQIMNLQFLYGETLPLEEYPAGSGRFTSLIRLENDFVGGFFTHGYEALQVTCAHEFFHCVQLSYVLRLADVWYYELCSTWMEDVAFDDVNDYYAYIGSYFSTPARSLNTTSGYESAHWNHFIEKRYDRSVIRASWEAMPSTGALHAIHSALIAYEDTTDGLARAFQQFAIWNFFTGYRSDSSGYYPEGVNYPLLRPTASHLADATVSGSQSPLSASYLRRFAIDSIDLSVDISAPGFLNVATIFERPSEGRLVQEWTNSTGVVLTGILPMDTITFAIVNSGWNEGAAAYDLTLDVPDGNTTGPVMFGLKLYPNPVVVSNGNQLQLAFLLHTPLAATLTIYTISGRKVHEQTTPTMAPGYYSPGLQWDVRDMDGRHVPSGVYVYRLKAGQYEKTGKISVVR